MYKAKKPHLVLPEKIKFNIQNDNGYVGSFLTTLGFAPTKLNSDQAFVEINLEQLVMEKPEYLFIAHYRDESIARNGKLSHFGKPFLRSKRTMFTVLTPTCGRVVAV